MNSASFTGPKATCSPSVLNVDSVEQYCTLGYGCVRVFDSNHPTFERRIVLKEVRRLNHGRCSLTNENDSTFLCRVVLEQDWASLSANHCNFADVAIDNATLLSLILLISGASLFHKLCNVCCLSWTRGQEENTTLASLIAVLEGVLRGYYLVCVSHIDCSTKVRRNEAEQKLIFQLSQIIWLR